MSDLLTRAEKRAMDLSAELARAVFGIVSQGPAAQQDKAELAKSIHDIQARILAQAAARAYPGQYRPLGGVPK